MSAAGPARMLAIYGGTTFLVYLETSGFTKDPPSVLLGLPLIALCILTLTTSMHPQPRFTTSASFGVLALSFYLSSSSWTSMAGAYSFICLANLLYYLSFSSLIQTWSIPLGVATTFFISVFSYHCFADLVVSIPFLVLLLSIALASSSFLLVAAGSLCQYGQHGDYDAHQASYIRFIGTISNVISNLLILMNLFGQRTEIFQVVSRILFYFAQGLMFLANERAF